MGGGLHRLHYPFSHADGDLYVGGSEVGTKGRLARIGLRSFWIRHNSLRIDCPMNLKSSIFEKWNKKIHIYVGLFMLLFLWIFSVSGLFLNHPKWFKGQPQRDTIEKEVTMLETGDQLTKASYLMEQLNLKGEAIFRGEQKAGQFAFIAMRPDERTFVIVNLESNLAKITHVEGNFGQMLGNLHTFSGVRPIWGEKESIRDWLPTRIWSFSIDALSVGLIVIVGSSLYMGFQVREKRKPVILSLALGLVICAFFIWGLV